MSRISFDQIERAPVLPRGRWTPMRFFAWTALLCAMTFWATLKIMA
jgi:hypothetical protein